MSDAHAQAEPQHASVATYVKIAVVLALITGFEVGTYYMHLEKSVLIPLLAVLSAAKFFLVVGWYMHLKYDAKIFRQFFLAGLTLAAVIMTVMISLFAYHSSGS